MSSIVSRILENLATRLMFIIYVLFIVVTIFFIGIGYYHELDIQQDRQYDRLKGIVSSLAPNVDGDAHVAMIQAFGKEKRGDNGIADSLYDLLNKQLATVQKETGLSTPVYTLTWNPEDDNFYYGVRSDDFFDVNNRYLQVPELLKENFETGGVLPTYETENGTWLSAFHPIKNKKGCLLYTSDAADD